MAACGDPLEGESTLGQSAGEHLAPAGIGLLSVYVHQPEARARFIALVPLEVVDQAPVEVPEYRDPGRACALQRGRMRDQVRSPVAVTGLAHAVLRHHHR